MDYESFAQEFNELTGIRLHLYKEKQMRRRINTLIARKNLPGYDSFLSLLKADSAELTSFIDYITINVTEFFRTPDQWESMEAHVLPDLLDKKDTFKIWSTACATGEEPYSLAVSLLKVADPSRFHIIATDINADMLQAAEAGKYSKKAVEELPDEIKERFFAEDDENVLITDAVKSCVTFQKLDLLSDPYPEDCDLIVCRNVLIYFNEEAKNQIYLKFKQSLCPDGWLFTGNAEQIVYYKKYGLSKIKGFLYQNTPTL